MRQRRRSTSNTGIWATDANGTPNTLLNPESRSQRVDAPVNKSPSLTPAETAEINFRSVYVIARGKIFLQKNDTCTKLWRTSNASLCTFKINFSRQSLQRDKFAFWTSLYPRNNSVLPYMMEKSEKIFSKFMRRLYIYPRFPSQSEHNWAIQRIQGKRMRRRVPPRKWHIGAAYLTLLWKWQYGSDHVQRLVQ